MNCFIGLTTLHFQSAASHLLRRNFDGWISIANQGIPPPFVRLGQVK